ncbi:MAG: diaminopimelate epimerase [Deltaproteobacteria bacterium]|nr:diaminopimelate epimerase [Deltaproteobacteria bacterium]
MKLPFTKMQGAGNDFVLLNAMEQPIENPPATAKKLCDRRFGIGADQMLVAAPSDQGDFRMDIYNADGGKVEMCGNGIRCFAKYVRDSRLASKTALAVETMAGMIYPELLPNHPRNTARTVWVKVDMGKPVLEGRDIPVNRDGLVINQPLLGYRVTCLSMGNPHCVVFVDHVEAVEVEKTGPQIENDPFFPNRVNVEFVNVMDKKNIRMRVWERGAGETPACGTGAAAAVVASVLNNKTDRAVTVHLRGGDLEILWDESSGTVFKTGPATTVFEGEIDL